MKTGLREADEVHVKRFELLPTKDGSHGKISTNFCSPFIPELQLRLDPLK